MDPARTHEAVAALAAELDSVSFALELPEAPQARAVRDELTGQIEDYVLPRLNEIGAPLLTVVGGSTGAGKSTLVNSLVGRVVSAAGVLRPTTTTPVLIANPGDLSWFESDRILPGLSRSSGAPAAGNRVLHLIADSDVPGGLALLDAPDVDSVVAANRELATQLLAAADLWLFVTTASRYADAVPWEFLRRARSRSTALALVLNRVPEDALDEVPGHLKEMLRKEGLGDALILTVPEVDLADGLIPASALAPVSSWLNGLASDASSRAEVVQKTLQGTLDSIPDRVELLQAHLRAQATAATDLSEDAAAAYSIALREIEDGLSGGALLRGEVLARWHEFIGTGDIMRSLQTGIGRVRDRLQAVLTGRPPVEKEVRHEVERSIETVVLAAADKAAETTVASWRSRPHGRHLIDRDEVPTASSPQLRTSLESEVWAWQGRVLDLVRAEGASKRATGRAVSFGVNAVGAALMIAVFAQTGGLTGGEVAIAGGTAAVSQRLLEALFGDEAVRRLTNAARTDLLNHLSELLAAERARFDQVVAAQAPPPEQTDALAGRVEALRAARL